MPEIIRIRSFTIAGTMDEFYLTPLAVGCMENQSPLFGLSRQNNINEWLLFSLESGLGEVNVHFKSN